MVDLGWKIKATHGPNPTVNKRGTTPPEVMRTEPCCFASVKSDRDNDGRYYVETEKHNLLNIN
jgi:hypothetical protein